MLLAARAPPKGISEILGRAIMAFTMNVHTEVAEEPSAAAADAFAA